MSSGKHLTICSIQFIVDNHRKMKHHEITQYIGSPTNTVGKICREMGIYREYEPKPEPVPVTKPKEVNRFTAAVRENFFSGGVSFEGSILV